MALAHLEGKARQGRRLVLGMRQEEGKGVIALKFRRTWDDGSFERSIPLSAPLFPPPQALEYIGAKDMGVYLHFCICLFHCYCQCLRGYPHSLVSSPQQDLGGRIVASPSVPDFRSVAGSLIRG